MDGASVAIRSTSGGQDSNVTTASFKAWKKRAGRNTAFVLQVPGADGYLVQTWRDMQALPPGKYEAELVRRVQLPQNIARRELEGYEAWKSV